MFLQYGSYVHQKNQLRVQQQPLRYLRTPRGEKHALLAAVTATGALLIDSQQDAVDKVTELVNAYRQDGLPLTWHYNDGTTVPLGLTAQTYGGTRVIQLPTLDNPDPTQWANLVWYSLAVEVQVDLLATGETTNQNPILSFEETVEIIGDSGPIEVFVPQDLQAWQHQTPRSRSLVTATQSGTLVMLNGYGSAPNPLWPSSPPFQRWRSTNPNKPRRSAPKFLGGRALEYAIAWTYHFESNVGLSDQFPHSI